MFSVERRIVVQIVGKNLRNLFFTNRLESSSLFFCFRIGVPDEGVKNDL